MAFPSTASCPRCGKPMEGGIVATTGVLAWQQKRTRLLLDGEIVGKKRVATTPNYQGWRCRECQLLLLDYSRDL
ncbi:MAG: PF20097 family protein [Thermoplasmata archaeon]